MSRLDKKEKVWYNVSILKSKLWKGVSNMFNVNGIRINFFHNTDIDSVYVIDGKTNEPSHGINVNGLTQCTIVSDENPEEVHGIGLAFCSIDDMFNKAIGRKVSLTRALFDSGFTKEERTAIWETYFSIVRR